MTDALREAGLVTAEEVPGPSAGPDLGSAGAMVDAVLDRAARARDGEPAQWP
jgi:hypothetical protein